MNGNTAVKHEERNKGDEWAEVMALAKKYGFIRFAHDQYAVLSMYEEGVKVE